MKRYHYASIDSETFLRGSKVPLPDPDAYLAKDQQTEALTDILEKGYRFVSLDPASNLAFFEKELPADRSKSFTGPLQIHIRYSPGISIVNTEGEKPITQPTTHDDRTKERQ